MTPNPIIFRRLERRENERLVFVNESVHGESLNHILRFDEQTFARLEGVFALHPFQKKPSADDVILFRGLSTPPNDPKKYLGLLIINSGSRHYLTIEASDEAFLAMKTILDSWIRRFEAPDQSPEPTRLVRGSS